MQKKRSKGVTAFAGLFLWLAFIWAYSTVQLYLRYYIPHPFHSLSAIVYMLLAILLILLALFTSVGLFMLKEWARKLALALGTYQWFYQTVSTIKGTYSTHIYSHHVPLYSIVIFSVFCLLLIIVPTFLLWWFFTRPKVKEQFKENKEALGVNKRKYMDKAMKALAIYSVVFISYGTIYLVAKMIIFDDISRLSTIVTFIPVLIFLWIYLIKHH